MARPFFFLCLGWRNKKGKKVWPRETTVNTRSNDHQLSSATFVSITHLHLQLEQSQTQPEFYTDLRVVLAAYRIVALLLDVEVCFLMDVCNLYTEVKKMLKGMT